MNWESFILGWLAGWVTVMFVTGFMICKSHADLEYKRMRLLIEIEEEIKKAKSKALSLIQGGKRL